MTDQDLLDRSLTRLKTTGVLEYTGEYGAELTTFIPFVCWLKTQGLLSGRRVVSYQGMRPYYYFLDEDEFREKPGRREWLPVGERDWPTNSTYTATRQPWHLPPDYRARYGQQGRRFRRPVLFIQNKFTVERLRGPINYLPLKLLETLFSFAERRFDVVYSRPGIVPDARDYTADENAHCDYPDLAVTRRFSNVLVLEELRATDDAPYNLTKLDILAKSRVFVAVQGGGAHLLAYFGNSVLLLLHLFGEEDSHAYRSGPYTYLSDPPPELLVARDYDQLAAGIELIGEVRASTRDVRVGDKFAATRQLLRA